MLDTAGKKIDSRLGTENFSFLYKVSYKEKYNKVYLLWVKSNSIC